MIGKLWKALVRCAGWFGPTSTAPAAGVWPRGASGCVSSRPPLKSPRPRGKPRRTCTSWRSRARGGSGGARPDAATKAAKKKTLPRAAPKTTTAWCSSRRDTQGRRRRDKKHHRHGGTLNTRATNLNRTRRKKRTPRRRLILFRFASCGLTFTETHARARGGGHAAPRSARGDVWRSASVTKRVVVAESNFPKPRIAREALRWRLKFASGRGGYRVGG